MTRETKEGPSLGKDTIKHKHEINSFVIYQYVEMQKIFCQLEITRLIATPLVDSKPFTRWPHEFSIILLIIVCLLKFNFYSCR